MVNGEEEREAGGTAREVSGDGPALVHGTNGSVPLHDSHIHLDDLGLVPADLPAGWLGVLPGVTPARTRDALAVWGACRQVRICAGVHPWRVDPEGGGGEDAMLAEVRVLVEGGEVDGVGEIGLDRVRHEPGTAVWAAAERVFVAQLVLAAEAGLPVVIHAVRVPGRLLELLEEHGRGVRGIVHAWTGAPEVAQALVELGYVVGIGGAVTRPDARRLHRTVAELPAGAWVLETDAPWIGVDGARRGEGRLEDVARVGEAVAEIRNETLADVFTASREVLELHFPLRRGRLAPNT